MTACQKLTYFENFPIYCLGPDKDSGPLPALFYFSLSGEESLTLSPYNQPALAYLEKDTRVFSFTLPGHGEGFDKRKALNVWAEALSEGEEILENFFVQAIKAIDLLIEKKWADPDAISIAGLSRGGFIAAHLAARHPKITTVLGFAAVTSLSMIEEFIPYRKDPLFEVRIADLDLKKLVPQLLHLHGLRFYIGNRDQIVGTDECYLFIRELAEKAHSERIRDIDIELIVSQSIGYKGHGTASHLFEEGISWLKKRMQGTSCKQ